MTEYVVPVIIFLFIGGVSGIILTAASSIFSVKTDNSVAKVLNLLPNINCGACGFSNCESYAVSIVNNQSPLNLCKPGGEKAAKGIGNIFGLDVQAAEREVAFIHCNGNCNAISDKYIYSGTQTCASSERYYGGKSDCLKGCLGYGDCSRVCDFKAISIQNGIAVVNAALCSACGLCVKECPNKLITLRKISQTVNVACSSEYTGKVTKSICKNGCIACKICEKKCPEKAIKVENNHAVIDEKKCTSCGICVDACPVKCLVNFTDINCSYKQ